MRRALWKGGIRTGGRDKPGLNGEQGGSSSTGAESPDSPRAGEARAGL